MRHVASQFRPDSGGHSFADAPASGRRLRSRVRDERARAHLGGPLAARVAQADPNGGRTTEEVFRHTAEVTFIRRVTRPMFPGGRTVNRLILDTGEGDDNVRVERNPGRNRNQFPLVVTVNGERHPIPSGDAEGLSIRAGQGNDRVVVGRGVDFSLTVEAGRGNDRVRGGDGNDRIEGGEGDDLISGGLGRDYINGSRGADRLAGGDDNDVIYGGDGRDRLVGDAGDDYLEGSRGNDRLYGNDGRDVLSGGTGGDALRGGALRDVLYAGAGFDRLAGGASVDHIYHEGIDRLSGALNDKTYTVEIISTLGADGIRVDPDSSAEFRERVEADLELLRSSRVGQEMLRQHDLAALSTGGRNSVTIEELPDEENGIAMPAGRNVFLQPSGDGTGRPDVGDAATIHYNTQHYDDFAVTPVTVLYHELTHTYNYVTGTLQPGEYNNPDDIDHGQNNRERQAVGLPNTGLAFDNDNDPATPPSSDNRAELNENALRHEMRLPRRNSYLNLPPDGPSPLDVQGDPTPQEPLPPARLPLRRRR